MKRLFRRLRGCHGLRRETTLEAAFHSKYDDYMEKRSPARKALYVFSKEVEPARTIEILERVRSVPSKALE